MLIISNRLLSVYASWGDISRGSTALGCCRRPEPSASSRHPRGTAYGGEQVARAIDAGTTGPSARSGVALRSDPTYQAWQLLHLGFTVAPIVAGLDKFFGLLVNWDQYLAPSIANLTPLGNNLMVVVGVIEIVAGLVVALRPRFGGYLVAAWLWGIIVNLLLIPGYYDIALRDFGLSLGALALARLSQEFSRPTVG